MKNGSVWEVYIFLELVPLLFVHHAHVIPSRRTLNSIHYHYLSTRYVLYI